MTKCTLNMRYSKNLSHLLKEYLQRCGPSSASQAWSKILQWTGRPSGAFLPSTSPTDPTCSPDSSRAAGTAAGHETLHSLFTACPYLFWGQTWASGWIFKNAIFPPLDRHLQTRGLVHCHTCRTGPCRRWASPSSWLHCPPWWSLWKPARETSEQTWTDWRRADGYIWSTHTLLV